MMKKYFYIAAAALLALAACTKTPEIDPVILSSDDYTLVVRGKSIHSFTENECQLGFNASLKQFRVGNDKMTDYYVLNCDRIPSGKDESVTASLEWTLGQTVQKRSSLKFKVKKAEDGRFWLWDSKDEIAVVVYKP